MQLIKINLLYYRDLPSGEFVVGFKSAKNGHVVELDSSAEVILDKYMISKKMIDHDFQTS